MRRTITRDVFKYDELSESAKAAARDWYRSASEGDTYFAECVIDDAVQCLALMGVEVATRPVRLMNGSTRPDPCVFWSGFSSQGDGACFEGTWRARDCNAAALREHAPQDAVLHRIADVFASVAAIDCSASFTVKHSGRYSHQYCTDFAVELPRVSDLADRCNYRSKREAALNARF